MNYDPSGSDHIVRQDGEQFMYSSLYHNAVAAFRKRKYK